MAIKGLQSHYEENKKKFQVLSEKDCETIINASFSILEKTGIILKDAEAVQLLVDNGASAEGELVKIPKELLINSINSAASELVLYDRLGNKRIVAGGTNTYFGLGPTNPYTNDVETGEIRSSLRADVTRSATVADACPNIDFVMGLSQISDCNVNISDIYEGYEMLTNTIKPAIIWGINSDNLDVQVQMADTIAGGHDKLVEKPFIALFPGCPVTPLIIDSKTFQMIKYAALSGLPQIFMSGVQLGTTSPVTIPGAVANNLAELLTGLTLAQLTRPGCAMACGTVVLTVDMATTHSAYGSPEHCLGEAINADIFHYLNLPTMQTSATDAKIVDEQAAWETAMAVITNVLSGGHMVHDVGFISGAMSGSLEEIVLTDEIIGYARRIERGISINEETLALEEINEVGPGGEFLTSEHTMEHFREETWFPSLTNREVYNKWSTHKTDMRTAIHEKTLKILKEHKTPALSESVLATLNDILETAEKNNPL